MQNVSGTTQRAEDTFWPHHCGTGFWVTVHYTKQCTYKTTGSTTAVEWLCIALQRPAAASEQAAQPTADDDGSGQHAGLRQ